MQYNYSKSIVKFHNVFNNQLGQKQTVIQLSDTFVTKSKQFVNLNKRMYF